MHVARVLAALILGCVIGEFGIGPVFELLARAGAANAPVAAVILMPCLVGALATAVALLVLPVKAVR